MRRFDHRNEAAAHKNDIAQRCMAAAHPKLRKIGTEYRVVKHLPRALALKLFFHSTICIHMGAEDIYTLSGPGRSTS